MKKESEVKSATDNTPSEATKTEQHAPRIHWEIVVMLLVSGVLLLNNWQFIPSLFNFTNAQDILDNTENLETGVENDVCNYR